MNDKIKFTLEERIWIKNIVGERIEVLEKRIENTEKKECFEIEKEILDRVLKKINISIYGE